jgi:hypothetical protein
MPYREVLLSKEFNRFLLKGSWKSLTTTKNMNYTVDALHLHSFEHAEASALEVFVPRLLNHIRSASCKVITVLRYEFSNMTSCSLAFRYQLLEEIQNLHLLAEYLLSLRFFALVQPCFLCQWSYSNKYEVENVASKLRWKRWPPHRSIFFHSKHFCCLVLCFTSYAYEALLPTPNTRQWNAFQVFEDLKNRGS